VLVYFPDLSDQSQIARGPRIRAIGWLSAAHPFPTGALPEAFRSKVRAFCSLAHESTSVLRWPAGGGAHTCELCGRHRGWRNLAVPGKGVLYVLPEMLVHYVDVHGYRPPDEFVDAVLVAPLPGTPDYARAVAAIVGNDDV
jgi:hypothetical protein